MNHWGPYYRIDPNWGSYCPVLTLGMDGEYKDVNRRDCYSWTTTGKHKCPILRRGSGGGGVGSVVWGIRSQTCFRRKEEKYMWLVSGIVTYDIINVRYLAHVLYFFIVLRQLEMPDYTPESPFL